VPHSGTFNGSEDVKTIQHPFYLPNMATADLFLVKSKPAGISLSQGGLMKNVEWGAQISSKNESGIAFWQ
jgi:hypothetical protein